MVIHTDKLSLQEAEVEDHKSQASLGYIEKALSQSKQTFISKLQIISTFRTKTNMSRFRSSDGGVLPPAAVSHKMFTAHTHFLR